MLRTLIEIYAKRTPTFLAEIGGVIGSLILLVLYDTSS